MNINTPDRRKRDEAAWATALLLEDPIDFIAEEHFRLRSVCAELDRLSACGEMEQGATSLLVAYLDRDLPFLLADEDENLLPAVMARATPEDEFPKLARRLRNEHSGILRHLVAVMTGLRAHTSDTALSASFREEMRDLAGALRRHLILENAILLPLARARLASADLEELRRAMLERRGLESLLSNHTS